MIIGNGDIASALKDIDRDDLVFFASGVSNSQETSEAEYCREQDLFLYIDAKFKHSHIVYFSSLSVFYSDTRYATHKREMEGLTKNCLSGKYTIIRLGNITWGDNPNTLINFLKNKRNNGEEYRIDDVYRYIVNKEEFQHWIKLIPEWNCEMNITGRRMKVKDIVNEYVNVEE